MVKKIATVLLCTALGSTLYAREDISASKGFIGLELGYATVQGDVGWLNGSIPDYKGSDVEYGIRIGAQEKDWRATFSFNYFDGEEDGKKQNYEKGLLSVDYFFLGANESNFRPFLGANVGYANYESTNEIDMSGFIYGAQAGFVLAIAENIDMDILYRYSISNATQEEHTAELDHIGSVVVGINYVY